MSNDIKKRIRENLFGPNKFNSNTRLDSWWIKRGLQDLKEELLALTSFLDDSASWRQRVWHIENDQFHRMTCQNPECNNELVWAEATHYGISCSKSCTQKIPSVSAKRVATNISRFGSEYYAGTAEHVERTKRTIAERYGDHPMRIGEFKNKLKQTKSDRYGDENYNNSTKCKLTKLETYGDENYNNSKKASDTMQKKYGVSYYPQLNSAGDVSLLEKDKLTELLESMSPTEIAAKYGFNHTSVYFAMHRHGITSYIRSFKTESAIEDILKELAISYVKNDRTVLSPKELDFYIPEFNLAIEVNGIYWHSTASPANRDKNFHFDKWRQCKDKGITLLSYTDADIRDRLNIIRSKLTYMIQKNKRVIGARKVMIRDVSASDEFALLSNYHMQGKLNSRDGKLGAYYNGELIAVINWVCRDKYLEITRFCTDSKASYPGLFTRMLTAVISETDYEGEVVSFSNNDHSNGNVYLKSGFKIDTIHGPSYWYTSDFVNLENRQNYMKGKIAKKFGVDITDKTEWQLMAELGYHRYYDSGKIKWVIHTQDLK